MNNFIKNVSPIDNNTLYCSICDKTDGMIYTSNPPKCLCTITNKFHYFSDECDCNKDKLDMLYKSIK